MKRRLIAVAVVLPLAFASAADAHTLTLRDAKRSAIFHARYLTTLYPPSGRPEFRVGGCRRISRHTVHCPALFRYPSSLVCGQTIRVRYISARRVRNSTPYAPRCR